MNSRIEHGGGIIGDQLGLGKVIYFLKLHHLSLDRSNADLDCSAQEEIESKRNVCSDHSVCPSFEMS